MPACEGTYTCGDLSCVDNKALAVSGNQTCSTGKVSKFYESSRRQSVSASSGKKHLNERLGAEFNARECLGKRQSHQ